MSKRVISRIKTHLREKPDISSSQVLQEWCHREGT
jgi:hypothetical protein